MSFILILKDQHGATTVETAIVLPIFLGFIFFTFSFGTHMLQDFRLNESLRMAGRLAAIDVATNGQTLTACRDLVLQRFNYERSVFGLTTPTELDINVSNQGNVRGLQIRATSQAIGPISILSSRLETINAEGFYPLEDQNACM